MTARVWDLDTGQQEAELRHHADTVPNAVAISADGRRAVSGGSGGTVRVWDLDTGESLRTLAGHNDLVKVEAVAISADGRRAVSIGGRGETVRIWDLANGKWVVPVSQRLWHRFRDRSRADVKIIWTNSVIISADGRRAVSVGGGDGTVRVWDLDTGQQQAQLSGHDGPVAAVAVSADGRRAVSGSGDGTVRAWDLQEGLELAFFAADSMITGLAVTPAGTRVIAGTSTGPVHLLELCGYEYTSGPPPAQEPPRNRGATGGETPD